MIAEDHLLFLCARQSFEESHRSRAVELLSQNPISWERIFTTAQQHGLAPLVYWNLQKVDPQNRYLPPEIDLQFKRYCYRLFFLKENREEGLRNALAFLNSRHIPTMLIKGAALDILVYDQTLATFSQDIDLILQCTRQAIPAHTFSTLAKQLRDAGIEYDFYQHHDVNINGALPVDFDRIWRDSVAYQFQGEPVQVMCSEDLLLSLCINSCRKRFFRLKSLCDIAETLQKYHDTTNWELLNQKARDYDCAGIIYAALRIVKLTVGCILPDSLIDQIQVSRARKAVIDQLIHSIYNHSTLAQYPYSGQVFWGRQLHFSLLLSYATYRGYQIRRKFGEVFIHKTEQL